MNVDDLNEFANRKSSIQEWLELTEEVYHPHKKEDFEAIIQRCKWIIDDAQQCIDIIDKMSLKVVESELKND